MAGQRVFISGRINDTIGGRNEMRDFRKAAVKAIEDAGMEPIYFDSTDPEKRWPIKPDVDLMQQLLEAVRIADVFVGLHSDTLNGNWTPEGSAKHSMELEYETAQEEYIRCLCYVSPPGAPLDQDMARFMKQVMKKGVEFFSTPAELYSDLLAKLKESKPRIFISYSSQDQQFVNELYLKLKQSGHHAWLNTESIPKGEPWHDEMVKALGATDLLILVMSEHAVASRWVTQEWTTFLETQKKIIPILLRDCQVPQAINELEMIKASHPKWYYRLLKSIEQNL